MSTLPLSVSKSCYCHCHVSVEDCRCTSPSSAHQIQEARVSASTEITCLHANANVVVVHVASSPSRIPRDGLSLVCRQLSPCLYSMRDEMFSVQTTIYHGSTIQKETSIAHVFHVILSSFILMRMFVDPCVVDVSLPVCAAVCSLCLIAVDCLNLFTQCCVDCAVSLYCCCWINELRVVWGWSQGEQFSCDRRYPRAS